MYNSVIKEEKVKSFNCSYIQRSDVFCDALKGHLWIHVVHKSFCEHLYANSKTAGVFVVYFTFSFFLIAEVSCDFLYSFISMFWMAVFDFKIQFSSSVLTASNLVRMETFALSLLPWPNKDQPECPPGKDIQTPPQNRAPAHNTFTVKSENVIGLIK